MTRTNVLWALFLATWTFSQIVYGAVAPWALATTALLMAGVYLAALLAIPNPSRPPRGAVIFLMAASMVFTLQLLPLPLLFSYTRNLRQAHGLGAWWPATADLHLTIRFITQFLTYCIAALFVLRLRHAGLSSSFMIKSLCAILAIHALYALAQVGMEIHDIPFYGSRSSNAASGTLVNRNSFAALMGMGLVASGTMMLAHLFFERPAPGRILWSRRVELGTLWALALTLFAVCTFLSQSRGGAVAAFAGLAIIPIMSWRRRHSMTALLFLFLAGAGLTILFPRALTERFQTLDPYEVPEDDRWGYWSTTLAATMRQPVLGFGMGTHPQAYHPFQPPTIRGEVQHAHNEYINVLFEGGVVWLAILGAALMAWFLKSWRSMRSLAPPDRPPITAAIAAVGVIALHSIVDFDLRITSIGMLFSAMLGIGASRLPPGNPMHRLPAALPAMAATAGAVLLLFAPLNPKDWIRRATEGGTTTDELSCKKALAFSPYDHRLTWIRAIIATEQGRTDDASRFYTLAADLWPARGDLQHAAGVWLWKQPIAAGNTIHRDAAIRCFHRYFTQEPKAVSSVLDDLWDPERPASDYYPLLPGIPLPWASFAGFLTDQGRWNDAVQCFERRPAAPVAADVEAIDLFAAHLERAGQWGLEAKLLEDRIRLKSDPSAYGNAARAWERLGVLDRALERASTAARIAPDNADWHVLCATLLKAKGNRMAAVEAYSQAVQAAPLDPSHRSRRAALYIELGLPLPAVQDLRWILFVNPLDRSAVQDLARALVASGNVPAARQALDDFLSKSPADQEVWKLRTSLGD